MVSIRGTKFDHDMEKGTSEISEWKNTGLHSEDLQSPWGRICRQQCRSVCSISLSAKLSGLVEEYGLRMKSLEASGKLLS